MTYFAKNFFHQYTKIVKTILRYLKDSRMRGITYGKTDKNILKIEDYYHSNWASDKKC